MTAVITDYLPYALQYHQFGFNVMPTGADKRPVMVGKARYEWEDWQTMRQTDNIIGQMPWKNAEGVAVILGDVSGKLVCLDFDKQENRELVETALHMLGLPLNYPWVVRSGSGVGYHIYLICPDYDLPKNKLDRAGISGGHVEIRYNKHYVVLPFSKHPSGNAYTFQHGKFPTRKPAEIPFDKLYSAYLAITEEPAVTPPPPAMEAPSEPAKVINIQDRAKRYIEKAIAGELDTLRAANNGSRNETLNKCAFRIGQRLHEPEAPPRGEIENALYSIGLSLGLSESETRKTIASGVSRGMENPLDIPRESGNHNNVNISTEASESREAIPDQQHGGRFRIYHGSELENMPPTEWLLQDFLARGEMSVIYGASGSGKSFVTVHMGLKVAQKGNVIYIASEGQAGYPKRQAAWCWHHKRTPGGMHFVFDVVSLMSDIVTMEFIDQIAALKPDLIIFDTLAYALTGGDENSARDMQMVITNVQRIIKATGAAVLLVHHTGKAGNSERGSSALRGAAYVMMKLNNRDGDLTLSCDKTKDAEPFEDVGYKLVQVETEHGQSCVILPSDKVVTAPGSLTNAMRKTLEVLSMEVWLTVGCKASIIASETGIGESTAYKVLSDLLRLGYIEQGKRGDPYTINASGLIAIGKEMDVFERQQAKGYVTNDTYASEL